MKTNLILPQRGIAILGVCVCGRQRLETLRVPPGARRPPPGARRPAPAARTPGTPPLKAKKCASAAGNAWAFDFARIALLVSGLRLPEHPRTQNHGPDRSRGVPGPGEPSRSTFFFEVRCHFFRKSAIFAGKKPPEATHENLLNILPPILDLLGTRVILS